MADTPRRARHFKGDAPGGRPSPAGQYSPAEQPLSAGQPLPTTHARAARAPHVVSSHAARMPHTGSSHGARQPHASANVYAPTSGAYTGAGYIGQDARRAGRRGGRAASSKPRRSHLLSNILIVAGILLMVAAAGMWGFAQMRYKAQADNNAQLAAYATISDDPAAPEGPQVDWAGLKAVNADVVGWVQMPGTNINFPVYQASDNDYYLHHTASGEWSIGGQIFMDYENARPGLLDRQTVIYGHHLSNGDMFTHLDDMASQEVFDQTPTVWYATEDATYELEPLFFYRTPATNGAARQVAFSSDEEFHTYLSGLLAQATAKSPNADEAVGKVTKVVTLATCDYDNDFGRGNGRGLVVCALKSEVETAPAAS